MSYTSKELIKLLKLDGWVLDRVNGSHHVFIKNGIIVVVPHPRKDMAKGIFNAIKKQAGLK